VVDLLLESVDLVGGENALAEQAHLHLGDGVAQRIGLTLGGGAIELVIVRERVGIGADDVAVDEGGTEAGAAVFGSSLKSAQAGFGVGAVDFCEVEIGKICDQLGDVSAGRIDLDGNTDGVAVVFDEKDDGQLGVGGGVERFPEFALRCGAFAEAGEGNLVGVERDVVKRAIIQPGRLLCGFGMTAEVAPGLGASDGVENLGGCR